MSMAKKETLIRLSISLLVICIVAAATLGYVYNVTKDPINKTKNAKIENAIKKVLPNFKGKINSIRIMPENGADSLTVHFAYSNGKLFGAAVETYTDIAFSGRFTLMVGFDANGKILETEVLEMAETPGLGDKIDKKNSDFPLQFKDKDPAAFKLKVKSDNGDVDAITAATISSRAFCDAVERAYLTFLKAKELQNE
jgi:electron transport complex protein RnfG